MFNDEKLTALAEQTLLSRFGKEHIDHIGPIMPGEDFYAFLENRPGFFVELAPAVRKRAATGHTTTRATGSIRMRCPTACNTFTTWRSSS